MIAEEKIITIGLLTYKKRAVMIIFINSVRTFVKMNHASYT